MVVGYMMNTRGYIYTRYRIHGNDIDTRVVYLDMCTLLRYICIDTITPWSIVETYTPLYCVLKTAVQLLDTHMTYVHPHNR